MTDRGASLSEETTLRELARAILDHAGSRAQYADLLVEQVTKVEVNLLSSGETRASAYSGKAAMQVRLVGEQGRHLEVSLGLGDFEALKPDLDAALTLLELVEPDPDYGLAPVPDAGQTRYGRAPERDPRDGEVDAVGDLLGIIDEVRALGDEVVAARGDAGGTLKLVPEVWAYTLVEEKLIADSEGLIRTQVLPTTFVQVLTRALRGERIAQTRVRFGDILGLESFLVPGEGLADEHRESVRAWINRAVDLLSARPLSGDELQRLTHIVLAPSAMVFLHEAQGHNFEADLIREKASGLFDPEGRPVIDPLGASSVDLFDGPPCDAGGREIPDRGFGTQFIDDEGVPLRRVQLVREGRIAGRLHNRETAHHFGEAPTGHGYSELGSPRVVRMTNTYVFPADRSQWHADLAALIDGIPHGALLEGSLGGAVSKDGMSTSIQYGRRIENGELTDDVLSPANLSVKTVGALDRIEGFAGEPVVDGLGFCGKEGQSKPVTDGGVYLRIALSDAITLGY